MMSRQTKGQPSVNRLVAGSNPARGANNSKHLREFPAPLIRSFFAQGIIGGIISYSGSVMRFFLVVMALLAGISGAEAEETYRK